MHERSPRPRLTFTEEIADIDRNIIKLLLKRHNLLQRLAANRGRLDAKTEQQLRMAWEKNAARVSHDPMVTRQLFSLLQEIHFLPKPDPNETERQAFGLAPTRQPVKLSMPGPKACRRTRLYLALAAGSGQSLRIDDTLLNDPLTECIKAFNQAGAQLAWQEDASVLARAGDPLPLSDRVIFVGGDNLNFHLLLGQYLGRASHAKFTGDSELKLSDLSALRRFAPVFGARLTSVIPKTGGLPVRLEASGILPQEAAIPGDLAADAATGLILAAPCWPQPVAFDLSLHPQADAILEETMDILEDCQVRVERTGRRIRVLPGCTLPAMPAVGMDLTLAAALMALPACSGGGSTLLTGIWPDCRPARELTRLMENAGMRVEQAGDAICTQLPEGAPASPLRELIDLPARFAPVALSLICLPALRGRQTPLPELPQGIGDAERDDFLQALDITLEGSQLLPPKSAAPRDAVPWTASSPAWAMAYALAAFARPRLKLVNPGIMTGLYPRFWALYNALPETLHAPRTVQNEDCNDEPKRKRLRLTEVFNPGTGETPGEA